MHLHTIQSTRTARILGRISWHSSMRLIYMNQCFPYRLPCQVVCLHILVLLHYAEVAVDLVHVIGHLNHRQCSISFQRQEMPIVDETHQLGIANILRVNVDHTMLIHNLISKTGQSRSSHHLPRNTPPYPRPQRTSPSAQGPHSPLSLEQEPSFL